MPPVQPASPSLAEPVAAARSRPAWRVPALLSGALLALAFPAHPDRPLSWVYTPAWAWVALVPLLSALRSAGWRGGFRLGWWTGAVANLLCLYWVAFTEGGGAAVAVGALLMAAYLGLYTALFGGCQGWLAQRWGEAAFALAPVLWTAQEYLLSLGELGFPWLLLGHGQAAFPRLIQHASWLGVYGVSAWVVLVNVLLRGVTRTRVPSRRRAAFGAGLAVTFALPLLHAAVVIPPAGPHGPQLRVALVQPSLNLEERWGAAGLERSFAVLESLSTQTVAQGPELVVWPEMALSCYLRQRPACRQRATEVVDRLGVPVLTGASDLDEGTGEPYNSAFLLTPGTQETQQYAKMHLVPFGERTPFRDRIPLLRDVDWSQVTGSLGPAEFARGRQRTLFTHGRAPFGALICFEAVFPDLVRRHVAGGARFLVNITNDSWYGDTAGPYQHARLSVLRAVENRRSLARCATSGVSLFVDPYGRTFGATGLFVAATTVGDLPLVDEATFYTRHGDLFAGTCTGLALAAVLAACLARRRGSGE
ncbi:MAG: apolipoprotein N-acyltransferase [Candidatus Latescibacterota bacterium]